MEVSRIAPTRIRRQQNDHKARTAWTPEEDKLLLSLVSTTHPNAWSSMAKQFPNKTAPQISGRWEKVLNPRLIKGGWTREEDEVILRFVEDYGAKDWAKLARLINGRTGKQCRERFKNHLDPEVMHESWTPEEDRRLIELHNELGNQWTRIASFMCGRTDNSIKNRWNSTLKKRLERMQSGQPLTQKRGRKPKSQQKIVIPLSVPDKPLPSAFLPTEEPIRKIEVGPLPLDHSSVMLLARQIPTGVKISSLAQNRLDFQHLLAAKS
jgi:hypothetical protein